MSLFFVKQKTAYEMRISDWSADVCSSDLGTKQEGFIFKAFGVPVVRSNNFPAGQNITNHLLSNTRNGNAYNGDFTNVVAAAFSPRALLAGEIGRALCRVRVFQHV